jgi:hypothetical protein
MKVWGYPRKIQRGIPAESVSGSKAAREHVILKHIVKTNA